MGFLVFPTVTVRESYLEGERATAHDEGADLDWLDRAAADFDGFVAGLAAPTRRWDVPVTQLWYVDGSTYVGTVVIRHELTPALARTGGHIGYHVVPPQRRRGHARHMLAGALVYCAHFGLPRVLVTCEQTNVASRKVIEANGGQPDGIADGELRYWITTTASGSGRILGMTEIPARLSIVTLGARDMKVLRSFYRQLGWPELPSADDTWSGFLLGGVLLGLFPIGDLTAEAAPGSADPTGWAGVTLACTVDTRDDVEAVFAAAVAAGATPVAEATDRPWGGRSAFIADPEGNRWEITWGPRATFDARGALLSWN